MSTYPARVLVRAIELAEGGWGPKMIADTLGREFDRRPHPKTVERWVHPERADRHRAASRSRQRRVRAASGRGGRLGSPHHRADLQETRAKALLAIGVTAPAVAAVMEFDYPGEGWTVYRVRHVTRRVRRHSRDREILALYEAGLSAVKVACELGISEHTVYRRLERLGVARRPRGRRSSG